MIANLGKLDEINLLLHTPDEAEKQKIKDSLPNLNFYKARSITKRFCLVFMCTSKWYK